VQHVSRGIQPECGRYQESINDMAVKLVNESKTSNMLFNAKKTKIMVAGTQNTRVNLQIDREQTEQVEQFKFLGSIKTAAATATLKSEDASV